MVSLGADPDALGRVAAAFQDAAATLEEILRRVGVQISTLSWYGRDSLANERTWRTTVAPLLAASVSSMRGISEHLRRQADEQLAASADATPVASTRRPAGGAVDTDGGLGYVEVPGVDPARRFLAYDTRGDGRAIEVFGDLWSAPRIGIWVPGVGTTIADFDAPDLLGAHRVGGGIEGLAMIEWLGYDPPDRIPYAAVEMGSRAGPAAADLNDFIDRLRAALPEGDSRTIVVGGHSYGAIVAAEAAALGTSADTLVLVGAPGVPVRSVDSLMLNGRSGSSTSVYVVTNPMDPIRAGSLLDDVVDAAIHSLIGMSTANPAAMIPGSILPHPGGHTLWSLMHTDPNTASFGATRLDAGPRRGAGALQVLTGLRDAHRYTEAGSRSLESIRRVYGGLVP